MVSLDTLLLCSACLTLFLALFFFYQNQGFCSHKIALIKKRVYIHNSKRILFSVFFSIRKSIPPTVWVERKRFHFVHQKIISLWTSYCTIKNGSRNPLNSKIELFMMTVSDRKPWTIVTKRPIFDMLKFLDLPLAFTNLQKL